MVNSPVLTMENKNAGFGNINTDKEIYQTLIDNLPFGIALIDKWRFTYVNNVFSNICGYKVKTLLQLDAAGIKNLIYKKDRDLFWEMIHDFMDHKGQTFNIETRVIKSNREIRWLDLTINFIRYSKNTFQLTALDITEKRNLEEQLMHSQKMKTMGQLTAGVAHQLSTPLAVITTRLQMLKGDLKKDGQIKYLSNVDKTLESSQNMSSILAKLVTFLKQSQNIKDITDINQLLLEITAFFNKSAEKKHISIDVILSQKLSPIPAIRNKLEQVFFNIIINAFDAMPNGGHIKIYTELIGKNIKNLKISFADTGTGMTKKVKERVFEPFFSTKPPSSGSGLGMFKSYCFVKEHNGKIVVRSKKGKGTQISVYLPVN